MSAVLLIVDVFVSQDSRLVTAANDVRLIII